MFCFRHSWRDVFEGIDPKKIPQSFGSLFVWVDLDFQ